MDAIFPPGTLMTDAWFVVKIMFLIGMVLYIIFAFVVVRQVKIMTKTLEVGFEFPLRVMSLLHFIGAIALFVIAVFTL